MRHTLILFLLILGLFYNANAQKKKKDQSEDSINYAAIVEGKYVIVTLNTNDKRTMLSLLHQGFGVYFDVKGKKKKNVYVKYPLNTAPPKLREPNRERNKVSGGREEQIMDDKKPPKIEELLSKLPRVAEYQNKDRNQKFNLDINALDITIAFNYLENDKEEVLEYILKIPIQKITNTTNVSKLSIGIISNKLEREDKLEKPNISMGGRGSGNGPPNGGGGGPGGGSRGGRGGGNSNDGPPQQQQQQKEKGINYWFKLNPNQ